MGDMVSYGTNDMLSEGYLARPEPTSSGGSAPAVIVIQEWWGLVPHIRGVVDRFAHAGFVALAPDLYHGVQVVEPDDAAKLAMSLRLDSAAKEIVGAADFMAGIGAGATRGVGVVGFCMGGSLALWSATLCDDITAAVGFYPTRSWDQFDPRWGRYAGKAALLHCSEGDGTSAAPAIQEARSAIEGAGGTVAVYDYPGTRHAFFNDDRPGSYDGPAAATSWARTLEFFRTRLN